MATGYLMLDARFWMLNAEPATRNPERGTLEPFNPPVSLPS